MRRHDGTRWALKGYRRTWIDAFGERHVVTVGDYCIDVRWPWWTPGEWKEQTREY